eukprot:CAMPEP_0182877284 /NCGR_PEP_ID=MMETSP0034_2-20130328/14658_1 /TAXON_ID=156128 /ORGANISM="Nephroselmis pyriformis, Strain CCMP717" /LENGTH=348 /DNA_ID=CAMNT_0025010117 /DNA_START=138 /DNA_END=1181 /DNA_ORIENTATION=-
MNASGGCARAAASHEPAGSSRARAALGVSSGQHMPLIRETAPACRAATAAAASSLSRASTARPVLSARARSASRVSCAASRGSEDDGLPSTPSIGLGAAMELLKKRSPASGANATKAAQVYLVGTGPGDPGLLTLHALQLMQTADVVLYDRLVSQDILDLVHDGATMVYVGKESGYHTRTQDEIHELLARFTARGHTVLRLKGGDPYVFGRGGEEMEFLEERGVRVRCVPGITAAAGIGAELGIPMTHRGVANSVKYLTGHLRENGEDLEEVAAAAADPKTTLVVYMGLKSLPKLQELLVENGLAPTTPAVAVERGTTVDQREVFSRLSSLPGAVEAAELRSPTLIII